MTEHSATGDAGGRTGRALSQPEIHEFLKRGYWGVLALSANDEPYGVPIIYGYDDDGCFYIASAGGKKIEVVGKNPNVTLTVVEIEDHGRRWKSVIVYGKAEVLDGMTEKLHAFNALRKQIPRPTVRLRDAAALARAKVIRITPTEMTGKSIGY